MSTKNEFAQIFQILADHLPEDKKSAAPAPQLGSFEPLADTFWASFPKSRTSFDTASSHRLFRTFINLFECCSQLPKGTLCKQPPIFNFCFDLFFYLQAKAPVLSLASLMAEYRSNSLVKNYSTALGTEIDCQGLLAEYFRFLVNTLANSIEEVKTEAFSGMCTHLWNKMKEGKLFDYQMGQSGFPPYCVECVHLLRILSENKPFLQAEIHSVSIFTLAMNLIDFISVCQVAGDQTPQIEKCLVRLVKICRNCLFAKAQVNKHGLSQKFLALSGKWVACKELVVDTLRINCKLSDAHKLAAEVPIDATFLETMSAILDRYVTDHYITGLTLHYLNNVITAQDSFQRISDSPLMTRLLATFEHYTLKVTLPAEPAPRDLRHHAQKFRRLRVHQVRRPGHH